MLELNTVLLIIAVVLLLPLYMTGQTLLLAAKDQLDKSKNKPNLNKGLGVLLLLMFFSQLVSAQTTGAVVPAAASASAPGFDIYTGLLILVIVVEVFLIGLFSRLTSNFFRPVYVSKPVEEVAEKSLLSRAWDKMNRFKPLEEEGSVDTGHNYDGIRELDNITPPWFTAGFLLTILFAIVYLWRYHVSESAPLQIEEYEIAVARAELEDAARLSSQANKVDENSVVMLGASDIEQGKKIFGEKCAPCHMAHGGSMAGGVGPNLTDDYWINGGSLKAVFTTIKYGRPDKGMISWKDQLSPVQMAQAASFIKSIKGSNPPGAKELQGDLYVEETATATARDSVNVNK
ncbi:MAG: cbb3-type cytochrome c oxidase N-terminal domain-containing protein [Saprospiraceae bacterium]|mgnify:CR=1 FL=1|nr:cbb3-type cytochrome c oxidase N-terminal domain-containing protein [Saprospiraceae bacterium]MDZ4703409.1 cbb3-type cytochrome c oxidase N-terminal domain-containing protein [Saprospiraceae bacterium]